MTPFDIRNKTNVETSTAAPIRIRKHEKFCTVSPAAEVELHKDAITMSVLRRSEKR